MPDSPTAPALAPALLLALCAAFAPSPAAAGGWTQPQDAYYLKVWGRLISGDRAYVFYFTHPDGQDHPSRDGVMPYAARRSSIQVAELMVREGKLACDRDAPCRVVLEPPRLAK